VFDNSLAIVNFPGRSDKLIIASDVVIQGALKIQVQHYREKMLHGENLQAVEH